MEKNGRQPKQEKQFEERLLEVRRVTRVTKGGRQLAFRAVMIIGDKKGKIGLGLAKSQDVIGAIQKATHDAYKNIKKVPIVGANSVPYGKTHKYKAALVRLMPAGPGTGLKAGSSVRSVLELAGYNNILTKILGTNNKLNNALATINALSLYKVNTVKPKKVEEKTEA
ncbi:ribosomal protein S5 [Candidatus Absconditicoccus praedator]|uniref:ribosomal protein S5 n=1 Tax=Candidatus Absconditicoccus praedator TaxID=2735562 RepID=UPI001E3F8293|nr:30S ribosomal protein S5 [Candidatus Absconditicoccus praedator]UFX82772.1 30S ribosomal protein S5 [Candidatus Absconditicoccus praedator]